VPPRLVLNGLALRPAGSGVQTYIRQLIRHLPAVVEAHLAVLVQQESVALLPAGVEALPRPRCAGVRRALHGLRPVGPADLVHGLDVDLPVRTEAPAVATVHDLSVFDIPWAFAWHRSAGERILVARAVARADAVIAVSAFTAERVWAHFRRPATVIHEAPSPDLRPPTSSEVEEVRARYGLPGRFVLHVGTVEARKNLDLLARACRQAGLPLVLAGAVRGAVPPGSRSLGWVPDAHLGGLYGAATAVAYPSVYEGFGLPPLEAMACGAAVVASRLPPLEEVLGPGALLVPAGDGDRLAAALRDLAADPARRAEAARAGVERARCFTWSATARATADVYRSVGVAV
jgi:glycosyltransferase involved in cell wall biosynthesis